LRNDFKSGCRNYHSVDVKVNTFFAEVYAVYYDYDNPKRKAILATVGKWMDDSIGKRDPENSRRPAATRKPGGI